MKKSDLIKFPRLRFYGSLLISLAVSWLYLFYNEVNNLSILLFAGLTFHLVIFSKTLINGLKKSIQQRSFNLDSSVVISICFGWCSSFFFIFPFIPEVAELSCFIFVSWLLTFYLLGELWRVSLLNPHVDLVLPDVLPKSVHAVLDNGVVVEVDTQNVVFGNRIKVYPNEIIPFDGVIIVGSTFVDESLISGSSLFIPKQKGDDVAAGTTNKGGAIVFEVRPMGFRSNYSGLLERVECVEQGKNKQEVDPGVISPFYVGFVFLFILATALFWLFFNLQSTFQLDLFFVVSLLIVSCPIFLTLSYCGTLLYSSYLFKRIGVKVKNYSSLADLAKVDAIVFDEKIWSGSRNNIMKIAWNEEEGSRDTQLAMIASLCRLEKQYFSHFLLEFLGDDIPPFNEKFRYEYSSDCGCIISYKNDFYMLGSRAFLKSQDILLPNSMENVLLEVYWVINRRISAIFYLPETLLNKKSDWMSVLRNNRVEFYLMSGLSEKYTQRMAECLSIFSYISNADADMKLDFVKNLQSQGKKVLVMGSSITDLLALTQADVSVVFADSSNVLLTITDLHLNMFDEGKLLKFITFAQTINRHLKRGKFISYLLPILSMISLSGLLYWFFQIILLGEIAVLFLVIGVILLIINIFSLSLKQ